MSVAFPMFSVFTAGGSGTSTDSTTGGLEIVTGEPGESTTGDGDDELDLLVEDRGLQGKNGSFTLGISSSLKYQFRNGLRQSVWIQDSKPTTLFFS